MSFRFLMPVMLAAVATIAADARSAPLPSGRFYQVTKTFICNGLTACKIGFPSTPADRFASISLVSCRFGSDPTYSATTGQLNTVDGTSPALFQVALAPHLIYSSSKIRHYVAEQQGGFLVPSGTGMEIVFLMVGSGIANGACAVSGTLMR